MLTSEEIRLILQLLGEKTFVEPTDAFPFRISKRKGGYSADAKTSQLQAKLSIMLEAKRRAGDES